MWSLHAYQHHVFMDWRFVDDEKWQTVQDALNGAGRGIHAGEVG